MIDLHINICASPVSQSSGLQIGEALHFAALNGYRAVALVLQLGDLAIPPLKELRDSINTLSLHADMDAVLAVELMHLPPALLPAAVDKAREAGAALVMVHGETLTESVAEGTNFAAIEAGADILCNAGLIDDQAAAYAAEKGVALELSCAPRHAFANAHILNMARKHGCTLVAGSCASAAKEIVHPALRSLLYKGAGLSAEEERTMRMNAHRLLQKHSILH